jgi:hypothetical protein
MDKVQEPNNYEYYTPSSESFRIYISMGFNGAGFLLYLFDLKVNVESHPVRNLVVLLHLDDKHSPK